MCLDKMEILDCNRTTGDIIPFSHYKGSPTKCDQPKIMGIYRINTFRVKVIRTPACPQPLQVYTWRHNKVLEVVRELLRVQCEAANQQPVTDKEPIIQFYKEGECPVRKQKHSNMKLLNGASDWKVSVNPKTSLQFPVHIVAWSDSKKSVLLIELTVPGGGTQAKEKPIRDILCRLSGKGLDMSYDSY